MDETEQWWRENVRKGTNLMADSGYLVNDKYLRAILNDELGCWTEKWRGLWDEIGRTEENWISYQNIIRPSRCAASAEAFIGKLFPALLRTEKQLEEESDHG